MGHELAMNAQRRKCGNYVKQGKSRYLALRRADHLFYRLECIIYIPFYENLYSKIGGMGKKQFAIGRAKDCKNAKRSARRRGGGGGRNEIITLNMKFTRKLRGATHVPPAIPPHLAPQIPASLRRPRFNASE